MSRTSFAKSVQSLLSCSAFKWRLREFQRKVHADSHRRRTVPDFRSLDDTVAPTLASLGTTSWAHPTKPRRSARHKILHLNKVTRCNRISLRFQKGLSPCSVGTCCKYRMGIDAVIGLILWVQDWKSANKAPSMTGSSLCLNLCSTRLLQKRKSPRKEG